jgi:phosphatidylglycerol lysyltransferase
MTEIFDRPSSPVVELVRRYGGPVSHAVLAPSHSIFRARGIDGLIGFLPSKQRSVVLGDPICASEDKTTLADAFSEHCAANNSSIIYTAASAEMQAYARDRGYGTMEFASLLVANPQLDPEEGHQGHHLRQHLNHTRRTGVTVHEYQGITSPDPQLEEQAKAACEQWLSTRQGPQMCIGRPRLFEDRPGRRWFIAKQAGIVVGMLSMLRISPSNSGNLINLVFSSPAAPLYTNELMVITALQALRKEGAGTVCLGVGPQSSLSRIEGCDAFTEWLSRSLYRLAAKTMHLQGKTEFWEKFHVTRREPLYLLFQSPRIGSREVKALLCTFQFSMM